MTIHFYEPPPRQRVGGLEVAISSLARYLISAGVKVKRERESARTDLRGTERALVHFHGLWQPEFLRVSRYCRSAGIPYVVSPHGMLEPWAWKHKLWKKWPYFALFERRHLQRAAALLATSGIEAANLRRFLPQSPITAIPLGLPEERSPDYTAARAALGWEANENVLLFLSRIHPKKGLELLLKALSRLPYEDFGKVRLVIVGDGDPAYVRSVQALSESLKVSLPHVDWVGPVWGEKKWSYLQGADLFCLPSYSENFGLATLEALQVGTPVLTTNTGPWEFLRDWKAGFVTDATEADLQRGLNEFFAASAWDDGARRSLAEKACVRFGWEIVGPQYVRFYQSLLRK